MRKLKINTRTNPNIGRRDVVVKREWKERSEPPIENAIYTKNLEHERHKTWKTKNMKKTP